MHPLILLAITFCFLIFGGVPISFSLALSSIVTLMYGDIDLIVFAQYMFTSLYSFPLLAIPLFICIGTLMEVTEITTDLIRMVDLVLGRVRGRLGYINVLTSMIFAGMSGSAVADTAGVGSVIIPAMKKDGYSSEFSVSLTAASSVIGAIIPPSIFMVVYGAVAEVSIGALFLGGAIPGVIVGLSQIVLVYFHVRNNPAAGHGGSLAETSKHVPISQIIFPSLIPVIIIGGILGGVFTATEAAAVAAVYLFAILGTIYRRVITFEKLYRGIINASKLLGAIMLCVSAGRIFGWILAYYDMPDYLAGLFADSNLGVIGFLFMTAAFFLILGTFESGIASIIVFVPIVTPVAEAIGVNPIHLGVIVTMCISVGLITPPYGLCLFLAAQIGDVPLTRAFKASLQFLGLFVAIVTLCIFVSEIVLWIPGIVFPAYVPSG